LGEISRQQTNRFCLSDESRDKGIKMGKVTGFMEFERLSEHYEEPQKRVKHYKEFVMTLSDDEAKTQGARCMHSVLQ
jgi:hypothetical protein